jgi:hypothetical protein
LKALPLIALILIFTCSAPATARADDFANSALGRQLIDFGLKFLDDPGDFFFNLHTDNTDYSPLPQNRHAAVRFNFLPTFMPFTWANLNAKVKVKNDSGYWPQIDLVAEYGNILAMQAIKSSDDSGSGQQVKPLFYDYSGGVTASKRMDENTRLFCGARYDSVNMDVTFSTPVVLGAFNMSSLNFRVADTSIYMGISHQTGLETFLVAQAGYGFTYKKITSRIMMCNPHVEVGMDIYPEGLLVIQPFLAWHWYF